MMALNPQHLCLVAAVAAGLAAFVVSWRGWGHGSR